MQPLWTPTPERIAHSQLINLMATVNRETGRAIGDYPSLHRFSVHEPERFWPILWHHAGLQG